MRNSVNSVNETHSSIFNVLIFDLVHVGFVKMFHLFDFRPWFSV